MTKEELQNLYPSGLVCENQYELGQIIHEKLTRKGNENFISRFPLKEVNKDPDILYDISELALKNGIAFVNDNFYLVEDVDDLNDLM